MCCRRSDEAENVRSVEIFLALGANLGNRQETIELGLEALGRNGVCVKERSSLYETEPVGYEDQPWFLNQVVRGTTCLAPRKLLGTCKRVEALLGRTEAVRFGPRTLDIDILLYGSDQIEEGVLIVPHPRMGDRRFVLIPLLEIAPEQLDPRDGRRFADILQGLDEGKKVLISTRIES
jgi:2-amino-4-hydroxy-6-hydroxymethyldihydropteridine diphosphokinase